MITPIKTDKAMNLEGKDLLTEQIIGNCYKVHNALGPGFPEKVYQAALLTRLRAERFMVEREHCFKVLFEGAQVGEFHVDLLVEKRVIVEVKAVIGVTPQVFSAQVLAYLKAACIPVGLLVNFGNPSCEVRRVALSAKSIRNRRNQENLWLPHEN